MNPPEPDSGDGDLSVRAWVLRMALAVFLGVGISFLIGVAAWSAPYSEGEIRSVESEKERQIRDLREQEITQLRIALGRRLAANRRADLYFRLAEIYLEGYRTEFLLEGRVHEKRLADGQSDPFIDRTRSKPFLRKGIQACQEVLKYGISFPSMDRIHYFLGFNYGELGDRKQSIAHFRRLVERHPSSEFVGEAYRELGDDAFDRRRHREAQGYYELALRKGGANTNFPRVLHRLAWSYYRTREYRRAVETMKKAVSQATESGEKYLSLREEALRDMAIFMSEIGDVEGAIAYYKEVAGGKDYFTRTLERLGKEYEKKVEPEKASQIYETLIKADPGDEAAFRVLVKLVDLDIRRHRFQQAIDRLKDAAIPTGGEPETKIAAHNLRAMIRRTATEHHEASRRPKHKDSKGRSLAIAGSFYSLYLTKFLAESDPRNETPEIRMYLAEVRRETGAEGEAAELYRQVVESGDSRFAKEAAALWVGSLAEAITRSAGGRAQGRRAGAPSAMEQAFVSASDRLQDLLPGSSEARESALRSAQILAGYNSGQADALSRCKAIVSKSPGTPQALTAARLWLQILSDRLPDPAKDDEGVYLGAADDLEDAVDDIEGNEKLMANDRERGKGALAELLLGLRNRVHVGSIAVHEKKKDHKGAAAGYESFAGKSRDRALAEKAFDSAAAEYSRAGDLDSVVRVSESWLKRYPGSPKAKDSLRGAATRFLIEGKFDLSARLFERLGSGGADAESLETAARLHAAVGSAARAAEARRTYLSAYPKSRERHFVALSLARALEASGDESEAAKHYEYCMGGEHALQAECGARLGDLYAGLKDTDQARKLYDRVARLKGSGKGGREFSPFVGYARFKLGEMMERSKTFSPLALPDTALKKGLDERLSFLKPLTRAYQGAVDVGGPWAVAALDRLAGWAMAFADEVDAIAPPKGSDEKAAAAFRKSLGDVSGPLRRSALSTWSDAYRTAVQSEALSPAVPKIVDILVNHRVSGTHRAQGAKGAFVLAGVPPDGGEKGAAGALAAVRETLGKDSSKASAWVDYGNLLYGEGKKGLASLAYERALAIQPKHPAALNNLGVLSTDDDPDREWYSALQAGRYFALALEGDRVFLPAKRNRAALLGYYRVFRPAKALWEQVLARSPGREAHDGLAAALQGLGDAKGAQGELRKAEEAGAPKDRFARLFHDAAAKATQGVKGAEECLSLLDDLDAGDLRGFEQSAYNNLKGACERWRSKD